MKLTNIELEFVKMSDSGMAAKFITEDGEIVWLPCSQIEFDWRAAEGDVVDVEIAEWIASEKGLI